MKKQSMKSKMHEHLGAAHPGKKKQSMKSRMHESEGMEHEMGHYASHADKSHRKMHHSKAETMHHKMKKMKHHSRGK